MSDSESSQFEVRSEVLENARSILRVRNRQNRGFAVIDAVKKMKNGGAAMYKSFGTRSTDQPHGAGFAFV
jgi:hypothetical protein